MTTNDGVAPPATTDPDSDPRVVPPPGRWRSVGLVLRAVQVRLRFIVVLAVAFLVVGRWDDLRNRWERLTRVLRGDALQTSVSNDTEYFCPMDPGVLSDWPGKCGVCNMSLVRRKKGEAVPLPSGVVARMQFSPYRLQLAGLQTAPAEYRPLEREVVLVGTVAEEGDGPKRTVLAQALDRDLPALSAWQPAEVVCEVLAGHSAFAAEGRAVEPSENGPKGRFRFVVSDPTKELRPGMEVTVRVRRLVAGLEPFRSLPTDPPPLRKGEPRSVYLCPEHAEVLQVAKGSCPVDGKTALEPRPLLANQRLHWWCPMHPTVTADRPGHDCKECGGMRLVPRVVTFRPSGQVLAVPESAVVDTGTRTVVYVERMPGMFDGVEVVLGPRCGDYYPVVRGLEPGQRVASAGAFLIDAETRLNPSLASAYFGAARGARSEAPRGEAPTARAGEPAELRALAGSQKVCPVTGKPLGSMGTPVLVTVKGRSVLICCEGCKHSLQTSPEQYLAKLDAAKLDAPTSPAPPLPLPAAVRP